MFVFVLPMVVAHTLLGCVIGVVVGRRLWGNVGGVLLGLVLGLAPAIIGLGVGVFLLWNSNLVNR
jgi:hypothetical protein